jgi:meso-butanediol dehydrogenase/(S,S)-butanediol dehydrogenase/diacetyl reductase
MRRFHGKSVIITGGASGIGLATAKSFAKEGATVIIAGRTEEAGQKAVQDILEIGGLGYFIKADVSIETEVENLMNEAMKYCSSIDVLVNNAAMFYNSTFIEEDTTKWKKVFDVIVNGTYFCSKHAARKMVETNTKGSIINVSSINSHRALNFSSHYNAGKGAVDQLTRCMALELSEYGIRVNGIAPGFIDTPMSVVEGVKEHETEEFKNYYVRQRKIPLARSGLPEEIANVITFLASDESSYIQGATIPVDGGLAITF